MLVENFKVNSDKVQYSNDSIVSKYQYEHTEVTQSGDAVTVTPVSTEYEFKTDTRVPKLGVMLVGWGGNNGTTVTGGILANKHGITWMTKEGLRTPNYWGSLTQAATCRVGNMNGEEVYTPFKSLLPMVNPNDIELGGWDISGLNLADAMERAQVLDVELQRQLVPHMKDLVPLPGIYDPEFIAANQSERATNVIKGSKHEQVEAVRAQIRQFKQERGVDKIVVLWTANTERYSEVMEGVNDTADNLIKSIEKGEKEVSPSTLHAVACILEGVPFVNGSPQNTFVPGLIDLAVKNNVLIGGDDFKSGQTKMKSVLVDFLVGAGIKPTSIVSYNHLGNNDGMNLSAPRHSLLAAPIILDLVILAELLTRIEVKKGGEADFQNFHPVAVLLSYLTKAPLVPEGTPVVNALAKQRAMLENIFRACIGLAPDNNMMLEFKN
eukprot:jgi/Picre1/34682/NNA_002150.t1